VQENDKPVLIYSTFPSAEAAEAVGRVLVERQLAACVNILPGMTSIYRWEGAIARDSEAVMIIKTRKSLSERVTAEVGAMHPYSNPALVEIAINGGSQAYVDWLMGETRPTRES
jgi:periplasmic divalent cation tolerance protein